MFIFVNKEFNTNMETRNYSFADVDMLIAASTIIETAIENKDFLITKRQAWTDPFFDDLKAKIDSTIKNNLGVDNAKELRKLTSSMKTLQKQAQTALAEFKVQIDMDFKKESQKRDEILNVLGFKDYLKAVQKGNQEALINLLYQFKTNIDLTLQTEITQKGINKATIDVILNFADTIKDTNVNQEKAKSGKKTTTINYITEFNGIYDEVIAIAKIASNFCKDNPTLKEQFSFKKVAKALSASKAAPKKEAKPETPKN